MYRGTFTRDTMQAMALRLFPDLDVPDIIAKLGSLPDRRGRRAAAPSPPTMPMIRRWIEMELLRRALRENPRTPFDAHAAFNEAMLAWKRRQHAAYTRDYRRAQTRARQRAYEAATDPTSLERAYLGEVRLKRESAAVAADLDGWFASVVKQVHRDEQGDEDEDAGARQGGR